MPTINQLVRKPRKAKSDKSKSPHLHRVVNSLKTTNYDSRYAVVACFVRLFVTSYWTLHSE